MGKSKAGHVSPHTKREPREIATPDAAPNSSAEDESSGLGHDTASSAEVDSPENSWVPPAEFDIDDVLLDGCCLESGDPLAFPDGTTVIDTGWHKADTFTIRAVFRPASHDLGQRDWMGSLLYRRDPEPSSDGS